MCKKSVKKTEGIRRLPMMILALVLTHTPLLHAAVYKTTDAQGNVVFTDIPPKNQDGETQTPVELAPSNTYAPVVSNSQTTTSPNIEEEESAAFQYENISITSPENDAAIRENAGNVTVYTRVQPGLQEGHQVQILLNGQPWPIRSRGAVAMTNVNRGTHSITAQIVDADEQVLMSSKPVTFHLQRVSILTRPNQANTPPTAN